MVTSADNAPAAPRQPSAVMLGTYDLGKPRTRLLRDAMRQIDPSMRELHVDVWRGVEDKSVSGPAARLAVLGRLLLAYPLLAVRYLLAGRHDVVVIGYLGLFDVLLLGPLARLRGKPVVWDAFLSVYDTWVNDRGMAATGTLRARAIRLAERWAGRLATRIVLDTRAHAALMGDLHDIHPGKLDAVLVGAEESAFAPAGAIRNDARPVEVLFYGQFIPLHGIDTIVDAGLMPRGKSFRWTLVGQGQEAPRIDARLADQDADHVTRIAWIDYEGLSDLMAKADICLGIFGTSDKAARVIPNKVYQALLAGKPLITRASPAMEELVEGNEDGLYLVPEADPVALLDALDRFAAERERLPADLHGDLRARFAMPALVGQWRDVIDRALEGRRLR